MTELAQLRLQVRMQGKRIEALEALVAARPAHRKRAAAPRPDHGVIAENYALWAAYLQAEMEFGHGRARKLTKAYFAIKHNIPVCEFYRLFSSEDRRGIPAGSGPFLRMRNAMIDATAELKNSHGKLVRPHIFPVKAAV
jgi:hypothetical protein